MTEHYTNLLQEVLNAAKELAIQKHNYQVDIPHVWTVLTQPQAFALEFYTGLDLDINEFISVINQELAKIPVFSHTDTNRYGRQYSQRLKNLLDDAEAERAELRDEVVTVEHLILSLFHQQRNPITVFLKQAGIDKELVAAKLNKVRQGKRAISPSQESRYQALSKYATNFNQWLADQTDRQVIGRKDEIDDIIRVLCRKEKSNAILLGFPGVGKSKVIEGFVRRLLADDVPEHLLGKEVFKLNLGGLIAGTKYRGEFEERFKAVLDEVLAAKGKIILYIEDIHQIVTAGRTEGSLDAGNLLKPLLAQGRINIIGTTTFAAYRESFELDQALEGRFQRVRIEEPDQDKALAILQGLRENYQDFHGVRLTDEALQAAMSKIEKDFGKGSIMRMGDEQIENVETIPTGSIGLDVALGVGGYPRGRIIEIYGPESSGKTTLAIHAIAEAQKKGGIAAFIDAEHAFDRFYAAKLGVDVDNLWISQPDNGEQALQIADELIRSSAVDILVVDSVAALTPKKEIEGDMGDNVVGLQARLMSQALRKLTSTISKTNTCCIFINQLREKIGVMFGSPETTTGGNALKFYSSVRLDIRRVTSLKDGDNIIGNQVRVKVVKNKVAPPFRKAEFEIMFGEGISKVGEILDLGVEYGIIQKSGSWFSYNSSKLAQGRDATKALLRDNPELCEELEGLITQAIEDKKA